MPQAGHSLPIGCGPPLQVEGNAVFRGFHDGTGLRALAPSRPIHCRFGLCIHPQVSLRDLCAELDVKDIIAKLACKEE